MTQQQTHWQIALGDTDYPGVRVTDADDIAQCLAIILNTPRGSDPLRPLFGCNILPYLDQPENIAVPNLMREITRAVQLWEPRIVLERVLPALADNGHWKFTLEWRVKTGVLKDQRYTSEVAAYAV